MQQRSKWNNPKRNLSPDDLVVTVDETAPRNSWLMGRVVKTLPGSKGLTSPTPAFMKRGRARRAMLLRTCPAEDSDSEDEEWRPSMERRPPETYKTLNGKSGTATCEGCKQTDRGEKNGV
ncbi:hypothetical protein AAFF_G00303590 [Aldrovandia affinis]|uniref:DUF5641 domain-containing protein n=1 Tax=Aldrovandia affinis TaxID=143900 RepID=A0AAD7R805_9TELE|nr:hypothetical protein AAFF_G00303590 [Aldrovandia affinis]